MSPRLICPVCEGTEPGSIVLYGPKRRNEAVSLATEHMALCVPTVLPRRRKESRRRR